MINSRVTNIQNIRNNIIPYMTSWILSYAWIVLFFTWWVNDFKNSFIFEGNDICAIYVLFLIFLSLFSFVVCPQRFDKYAKIGGIGSVLIMIAVYLLHDVSLGKNVVFILPIFVALFFISLLHIFIYIMNNTEKLYSMIISNFILISIVILQDLHIIDIFNNYIFMIVMFALSLIPIIKFNKEDYKSEEDKYLLKAPKISKILYISLIINCIFLVLCRGVGRAFLLMANDMYPFNLEIYYYAGGFVGCIIIFILYSYFKKCNIVCWNIVFSSFILAAFIYLLPSTEIIKNIFAFVLGFGIMIGINIMYYTLGVISKKYWDFSYVKFNILIIALVGCGFGTIFGKIVYTMNVSNLNLIVLTISVVVMIILLIVSPYLMATFFNDKWTEDSIMASIDNENIRKLSNYGFTVKEMEVCNCVLNNLTVRQIAAQMNISENTVKFHKKQIFKKLDINSKEELIKIIEN